jgi:hypothetical protein
MKRALSSTIFAYAKGYLAVQQGQVYKALGIQRKMRAERQGAGDLHLDIKDKING